MTEQSWPVVTTGDPPVYPDGGVALNIARHRVMFADRTGVVGYPASTDRTVYADGSGLQVKRRAGARWIQGIYGTDDAEKVLPIDPPDATLWRVDRVVDRLTADGVIKTFVKAGTADVAPVAPPLTQNAGGTWEVSLASFRVPPNAVTLAAVDASLVDERRFLPRAITPVTADLTLPAAPLVGDLADFPDGTRKRWTGAQWRIESQPSATWAGTVQADVLSRAIAGPSVGRFGISDGWLTGACTVTSADVWTSSNFSVRPLLPLAPVGIDRMPIGLWSIVRTDGVDLNGVLRYTIAAPTAPLCMTESAGPVLTTLHVGDTISWSFHAPLT